MAFGSLGLLCLLVCMGIDADRNDSNMADNIVDVHCDTKICVDSGKGAIPKNVCGQHRTAPERRFPWKPSRQQHASGMVSR